MFLYVQSNAADLLVLMDSLEKHVKDRRSLQYIKKFTVTLKKLRGVGSGGEDGGCEEEGGGGGGGGEGEGEGEGVGEGGEGEGERMKAEKGEVEREEEGGEDGVKDDTLVASIPPSGPTVATGVTKTHPPERDRDRHIPDDTLLVTPNPSHTTAPSNTRKTTVSKTTREMAKSQGTV